VDSRGYSDEQCDGTRRELAKKQREEVDGDKGEEDCVDLRG
jgi:hypothetical protein